MKYLKTRDKQTRFSIRKYSVGVFSVSVATLYFLAGGNALAANDNAPRVSETSSGTTGNPDADPKDPENKDNPKPIEDKNTQTSANAEPKEDKNTQTSANAEPKSNKETLNTSQPTGATTSTRGARGKRALPDGDTGTESGNNQPTGENSPVLDTNRKGETVKDDQPGVRVPKKGEDGSDDKNANLRFDNPGETATVEEMWKIIQNMPDDFQNNERSYLRNMNTLGDALRFKDGEKLQDGEIREINEFGGWKAIDGGKFAIGKKNAQGYFTGWYKDGNGVRQEGGMLGSNALDQIYVHEQALDRRFNYMLMLAKGRTIANKDDEAQDGSPFKIETENRTDNREELKKLPVKEKEDILQHSPNLVGFNGIEKTFAAFSTKYGSRLKIDFVTGYISDFEGSKGTYRIVVKAIKKGETDNTTKEETIYDHTINRIDGVVENEERYSQGVDLSAINNALKTDLRKEYEGKVDNLAKERYKKLHNTTRTPKVRDYGYLKPIIEKELAKKGETIIELPIDKFKLNEQNFKTETKLSFNAARYANNLNAVFKKITDEEVFKNSPAWGAASDEKGRDPDRLYKLLDFVLPTAKKIIYHGDTDQLELQTDPEKVTKHRKELKDRLAAKKAKLETADESKKIELRKEISALESAIGSTNSYTYLEARNGKEAKILGSHMEATEQPSPSVLTETEYNRIKTNDLAANEQNGLERFTKYFVEKENVTRSKVLPDDELSEKITEAIDRDKEKLGKGGYFSTGDIPLEKDVVAYKVQVFAENKKRVGVNKQSPRLQYNLPILADFSVIQDTVEPSKEVTTRIITKLKEQGKITEEQEKKIKEEIKKSKKTSEIRSQLSGDVKVKYQDANGNVLTLDNTKEHQKETDLGKKDTDGTYLAVNSGLRYTNYDVTAKKLETITTSDGKQYRLKKSSDDGTLDNGRLKTSAAETGTISESPATVTYVYEEYTPPTTGKGIVHFKKKVSDTEIEKLTGYDDITLEGEVGEEFSPESVNAKITELKNAGYEIVTNEFETKSKTIDSTVDEEGKDPSQVYDVIVKERTVEVTEPKNPNDPVDPEKPDGFKFEKAIEETNLKKDVTRTINYFIKATPTSEEIESGKTPATQKVTFKRSATYNLVTKTVTYGDWSTDNKDFPTVTTPELEGYTPDKASVEATQAETPAQDGTVKNITEKVIYTPKEQKLLVKVFNITTGQAVELPEEKIELKGKTNELVNTTSVKEKIKKFKERGYVVQDNPIPNDLKYDTKDDLANQEPTQVYKLFVREPISVDTDSKTVTRTIKYVKKDYNNGVEVLTEASKTVTDTATFNREIKFNLVTGKATYGTWSENKTFEKVTSPVVTGYIADRAEVAKNEVTANTEDINEEVIYTKIGNWIPNKPGETPTPIPYPNHPTDPTKPGEPTQVIPHVPGYTPKVGDKPLIPKNPKDLTEGYTPPTPNDPKTDTPIEYAADPQKAVVKVYNVKDREETELTNDKLTMNGKTDEVIPTQSLKDKIEELKKRGYIIDEEPLQNGEKFDNEKDLDSQDPTQVFKLKVHEKLIPVTPPTADKPLKPGTPIDPDAPVVPNTPNDPLIPTWTEELINRVKNAETTKEVTRTINYVDESNNKVTYTVNGKDTTDSKTDKVTFTREAKINVVTKDITYGEWTATDNDRTFDAVPSPVVKGYILKANQDTQNGLVSTDGTSVVASENLTATSENQNLNVVYTKLGSWIPKVPGEETPTPLPYPNDPNDPTKPGKPTDPNTPVIPYVPGYTPKIGETPLEPKVPGDPTKGYIPPDVPKEPGTDTEITYEGNPQKILIKVVNVTTGVEVPLDNEKLEFNGKSGETVKETDKNSVDTKITSLRNRGYIVDTVNPLTATTKYDTESDAGKQEPTQTYKLVVREKISADKESTTVTRKIKYVKVDVQDGKEVRTELNTEKITTKVDKVEFSRDTTTNLTTGLTEIGTWNHEKQEFSKLNTPVLEGYLANKVSVPSKEVTPESASIEEVVEYRKIGSWIPNVPGGKTPTPIPYPNDPDDPTKPMNPEYPTTPPQPGEPEPKVPVIPYVPGYTPKIGDKPLEPVDPNHPENGYKVPPVPETPNDPKKDTPIEYEADTQKAVTKFVDSSGTPIPGINNIEETGKSGEPLTKATEVTTEIAKLIAKGYDLVSNNYGQDNNGNFDKDSGKDQEYTVVLKPHIEPIKPFDPTNPNDPNKPVPGQPINPATPVDPNNPNDPTIPRWTEDLINKLETTKHVTRTISYVDEKGNKVEYPDKDGNQSTADVIDKVTFIREAKINVVTGVIEYGKWTPVNKDTTFDKVTSPVVKGYILKDASQKEVAATENITENSKDETIKVVYVPVGTWTPKVPEGETPVNPIPYPNDPTDPGKVVDPNEPRNPNDPNKPSVPAIPHIPGTTPKVPKVPNKPVSPENPLVPLTPVDPEDPTKGYVPPTPTTPTENTEVEYVKDEQKATVTYVVEGTNAVLHTDNLEGVSGTPINYTTTAKLTELKLRGYELVTDGFTTATDKNFDKDTKVDQSFVVTVKPKVIDIIPVDPTNPNDPNKPVPGQPIDPDTPVDPNNPNDPTIPRWTDELINKLETTKQVTRTINYVDEKGNEVEKSSRDKVKFTREAKINVVTGEITYGDWKAVDGDDTFDAVKSPVVKGYILKDANQKEVSSATVKSDTKDETITVTYTKVGSYVPKVPEGVTPPSPTPYDNDPEDPTKVVTPNPEKPQDPKDPNSPKVPVLPQVPGHTPIVPKDPTKPVSPENPLVPLTPVDPNHPEKGYNVPPVPTTPGQDTPIEYVKDGQQRAIVNFVDENGNSVVASILQTGKAGDKFTKDTLVKSTISELQSNGYEVKTNDYPTEGTGVFDNDTKVDQIFTVTVRKIEVLPPRPRVIERPGGNTVVEVGVPNKDADKLNIWYIKRNNPTAPKEEIVTKKDNGTWKIEKAPEGVTINPSTGIVSIPGNKIQPKTWIDTQTAHETKISKIVRVMPNISDLPEFKGITMWIEDKERTNLKDSVDGVHERGEFTGYEWKESILEGNIITHIFKKLSNPDNPKFETGINVIPPTPKIVDRPGGGGTVEVGVPNKDADTLIIKYTKRNNPNDPKEEIITKKDKDGTWKIEKSPDGVTINPATGVVYIPSKQIEPKTSVDTQTKHGDKPSKVVSVVPNISELKEFKGITEWIDVEGKVLKPSEEGIHEKGRFDNLVWLESQYDGNKITHIFGPGTPTVDKPEYKVTVWFDKDGNPIKPDQPGTHESGKIPGYRFITTTTKDGVTVHTFEKIIPVDPNKPTPENPNTPNPEKPGTPTSGSPTIPNAVPGKVTEKQQVKRLANTGATETNTGLAGLGLAMVGMALAAIKRRKEK